MSNIVTRDIKEGSVPNLNRSLERGSQNLYEKLMNIDNPEKILNQYLESNTIKDIDISSIIKFYNMLRETARKEQEARKAQTAGKRRSSRKKSKRRRSRRRSRH